MSTAPESIPRRAASALGISVAVVGAILLVLWCLLLGYSFLAGAAKLLWDLIQN